MEIGAGMTFLEVRLKFARARGILCCKGGDVYETLSHAARGGQV